ncbi:hypothetical protein Ppb6_03295 [Photorhabdus australis subsp. thailandensis]|uniref:Uncharacterized protein n=1 Tax=Photorhabdus australis subsp. thailandensis TaxID=2805096 RepID=A0A1C0U0X7_9GAMM|nr:hypothetical protein Ppb6_03295 [Photorhabdus australis subsp. thailandensis]
MPVMVKMFQIVIGPVADGHPVMSVVTPAPQCPGGGHAAQPVLTVVAEVDCAAFLIKQSDQSLMGIIFLSTAVTVGVFFRCHQPESITGQGGFSAIRSNKSFRLALLIIQL